MNVIDGLLIVGAAMIIACAVLLVGCALIEVMSWMSRWRFRRRMRHLPPPDDPRLRNSISLRDWKDCSKAAAMLRRAA